MSGTPAHIARKLKKIQAKLRRELFEELKIRSGDLETVFDPYSYTPLSQELRDKFLTNIFLIQAIIQQLCHLSEYRKKASTVVVSVNAANKDKLVQHVNEKLASLNGSKILGVDFLPADESKTWTALITYVTNPLLEGPAEPATLM